MAMKPTIAAVALLGLTSCQPPSSPLTSADRAAIQRGSDEFIRHTLAGNPDSISLLYAEDAILMPSNMSEVRGRAAIRAFFAAFPPVAEAELINDTVVGFGDLAYVKGRYRSRLAVAGAMPDSGKFLEIRRRDADGSWRFVLEIFNTSVPLPAAPRP
jgi:ketosteroid isomerase-like protein